MKFKNEIPYLDHPCQIIQGAFIKNLRGLILFIAKSLKLQTVFLFKDLQIFEISHNLIPKFMYLKVFMKSQSGPNYEILSINIL